MQHASVCITFLHARNKEALTKIHVLPAAYPATYLQTLPIVGCASTISNTIPRGAIAVLWLE
jgi:hypothetical protein